jgi:hypothetical protein
MVANLNAIVIYLGIARIYHGILILENVGTAVNYHSIFITLAHGDTQAIYFGITVVKFKTLDNGANPIKHFTAVIYGLSY